MLKPAYYYKSSLEDKFKEAHLNNRLDEYQTSNYNNYNDLDISDSDWSKISYVSVDDNDNILGCIHFYVVRSARRVNGVAIVSFSKSPEFMVDLVKAIDKLVEQGFVKLEFSVNLTNIKGQRLYDRFVENLPKYSYDTCIRRRHRSRPVHLTELVDVKFYDIYLDDPKLPRAMLRLQRSIESLVRRRNNHRQSL